MYDGYVNDASVNGSCPLIIEESLYGSRVSSCDDYCGSGFLGCCNCYFEDSEFCIDCIHRFEKR